MTKETRMTKERRAQAIAAYAVRLGVTEDVVINTKKHKIAAYKDMRLLLNRRRLKRLTLTYTRFHK